MHTDTVKVASLSCCWAEKTLEYTTSKVFMSIQIKKAGGSRKHLQIQELKHDGITPWPVSQTPWVPLRNYGHCQQLPQPPFLLNKALLSPYFWEVPYWGMLKGHNRHKERKSMYKTGWRWNPRCACSLHLWWKPQQVFCHDPPKPWHQSWFRKSSLYPLFYSPKLIPIEFRHTWNWLTNLKMWQLVAGSPWFCSGSTPTSPWPLPLLGAGTEFSFPSRFCTELLAEWRLPCEGHPEMKNSGK